MKTKQIPKFEELEKITLGQEVIIKDEGIMKFAGVINSSDSETGDSWTNPVFLSKVSENDEIKYKEIEILTKCNGAIYKNMINTSSKNYDYVKKIWENLN